MSELPKEVKCAECGAVGRFTICRVCSTPTPEAAEILGMAADWYDGRLPERDEDERLDDPRHGQAAGINRDSRGRS